MSYDIIVLVDFLQEYQKKRCDLMDVSYNKLFKLLIDKGMKKTDLRIATGISPNTLTKLSNNDYVSMEVLVKICRVLECNIGDIVDFIPEKE
jgi:DNA-binding Xre family transcriptional regulator